MKTTIIIALCSFWSFYTINAQESYIDSQATNYNTSSANSNSVTTTLATSIKVNTPRVKENSGIEYINGSIYTFGDSGNPASIFKIDTVTGNVVQTIHVSNYGNTDWEDITDDATYLYIGDFGNNDGDRTDLKILKIAKAQFANKKDSLVNVTAEVINFSYADQTSFEGNDHTNFDCESILSFKDSLYLFTKDRGDLKTRVYRLPKTPGSYTINPYTNFNVNGKITGADYNPFTNNVVLIGYMGGSKNSFVWLLSDFKGANFFSGNTRRLELGNISTAWQTEGVAFCKEKGSQRIFISCETKSDILAGIYVANLDLHKSAKK